jgi:Fe-coproporphyrin III synthase
MHLLRKLLDPGFRLLRAWPAARRLRDRCRLWLHERSVAHLVRRSGGRASASPAAVVYEATMRCNLKCEFCYVGDLLNVEGEFRRELSPEALDRAFPARQGLRISITGGEVLVRRDIVAVLDVFRRKGYACDYITTNGTAIDVETADALARLALSGFLRHVSISVDGPRDLHDAARGVKGTFDRASRGMALLHDAVRRHRAPLRLSVNTTVTAESVDTLDQMAEVAQSLQVDAIGLNHLMYATREEVEQTLDIIGESDSAVISTYVPSAFALDPARLQGKLIELENQCRARRIILDCRPNVSESLVPAYYTPGAALAGRCLYPFKVARVGFSGKVYFCPFIRVEIGDLTCQPLAQIWNSERYVAMRRLLLEHQLFPVCQRCCKVELFQPRKAGEAPPRLYQT